MRRLARRTGTRVMGALGASGLLTAALSGCGGSGPVPTAGPDPCEAGEAHLRQRLGPEFNKLVMAKALPADGCALVFMRVAEEMPEEMEDAEDLKFDPDHELAFAVSKGGGRVAVDTVPRSSVAPGPVVMALSTADVTGDGVDDLVIEEKQGEFGMTGYRGLRVFDVSKGAPREAFAEKLSVTTPEGLTMVPSWSAKAVGGVPAIVFDGAGEVRTYAWQPGAGRFVLDAGKSSSPKPVAPPAEEVAAEPPPPPPKPMTKAEKAAAAKAEKAAKAAQARAERAEKAAAAKAAKAEKAERLKAEKAAKAEQAKADKAAKAEKAKAAKAAKAEKGKAKKAAAPAEAEPAAVEEPLDLESLGL